MSHVTTMSSERTGISNENYCVMHLHHFSVHSIQLYHFPSANIRFIFRMRPVYIYIYIYIYNRPICIMVRVLVNGPGFNPRSSHTKDSMKLYLMLLCLTFSIIKYGSRVSESIQRKEQRPPLNLGVVAIEKRAFRSPSTTVGQCIYIYIYIAT